MDEVFFSLGGWGVGKASLGTEEGLCGEGMEARRTLKKRMNGYTGINELNYPVFYKT